MGAEQPTVDVRVQQHVLHVLAVLAFLTALYVASESGDEKDIAEAAAAVALGLAALNKSFREAQRGETSEKK